MRFDHCLQAVKNTDMIAVRGRVSQVIGMVVESHGPGIPVGSICEIGDRKSVV
jgi:flagellum-specific ATP synthase